MEEHASCPCKTVGLFPGPQAQEYSTSGCGRKVLRSSGQKPLSTGSQTANLFHGSPVTTFGWHEEVTREWAEGRRLPGGTAPPAHPSDQQPVVIPKARGCMSQTVEGLWGSQADPEVLNDQENNRYHESPRQTQWPGASLEEAITSRCGPGSERDWRWQRTTAQCCPPGACSCWGLITGIQCSAPRWSNRSHHGWWSLCSRTTSTS